MPVNLSIKRVPDKVVAELKRRAAANHRSLQGELLKLLEDAVEPGKLAPEAGKRTVEEVWRELQKIGLHTPDTSVQMIREDRDAR